MKCGEYKITCSPNIENIVAPADGDVPEPGIYVDPASKTVFFGTEAEVRSCMDRDGQV